ncbi:MAG: carboxypeptidase regulatory-like domain-containing protein, partial [Candidatus Riflebacteria bacterium]|nr:carboxypeptidase regulatory-like domain-containing protein [Candidatus Riflebacteria bacterium]
MKRKALCFVLALFVIAIFSLGCGGGGGSSNPASSNIAGQARVSGVVYDSSNNPVPNASVKLALSSNALVNSIAGNINTNMRLAATANQTEFNTVTNSKGEYIFTNVPYGEYTLSAVTADGGQIVAHLDVRASVVVQPDMTIMPFGSITGVVTDSKSSAIKGALVYLDGTSYCSVTDAQGCYTINYVPVNTNFTLCAAASGYASLSRSVKILASESLKLNTDNAFETVKFELSTVTAKAAVLSCTIAGSGAAQDNLVVIAVNQADGTTFVGSVVNSKSSLKITKTGKYDVFAASIGNGNNNIGDIITKQINDLNSTQEVELSIGMPTASSKYASLSGTVVPADGISDTSFEVAVYDSTGHEHKQIAEANATFTFNNLLAGKYALAVSSDNSLYIRREITLSEGENKAITDKPIKTVKVAPSFSPATNNCYSELTGITNPAESGTTEVYFSAYGYDSESEPVLLYGYDKTNKRVSLASDSFDAGSVTNCSVC